MLFWIVPHTFTDPSHKNTVLFSCNISQPTHRPFTSQEIVQHWNIKEIKEN